MRPNKVGESRTPLPIKVKAQPKAGCSLAGEERVRLQVLQDYALLDSPPEPELDDLTAMAAKVCETPIAIISLVNQHRLYFKSRVGVDVSELPRPDSFCEEAMKHRDFFVVPDAEKDIRFSKNALVTGKMGIRFYAGTPLISPEDAIIGMLCAIDHKPRQLAPIQKQLLGTLAAQVMSHFDKRRAGLALHALRDLSPGIHDMTLEQLRPLVCTNAHRHALWGRLISFLAWPISNHNFSHAYIGGGFISDKEEPRDIDLVLETNEPYGPSSFAAISRFFLIGLEPIHEMFSVHLQFWMQDAPPGMSDYRSFFQYLPPTQRKPDALSNRRGIVRIDLRTPDIIAQFQQALAPAGAQKLFASKAP